MSLASCQTALSVAQVADYWLGDLPPAAQNAVEEHLFACAECSARLGELVALGSGIRALARQGEVNSVVTADFVERLKAQGAKVREYRMRPGQSVFCSIAPDEDLAVAYLEAPLAEVSQSRLGFRLRRRGLAAATLRRRTVQQRQWRNRAGAASH